MVLTVVTISSDCFCSQQDSSPHLSRPHMAALLGMCFFCQSTFFSVAVCFNQRTLHGFFLSQKMRLAHFLHEKCSKKERNTSVKVGKKIVTSQQYT